jgi:hypothetical protein
MIVGVKSARPSRERVEFAVLWLIPRAAPSGAKTDQRLESGTAMFSQRDDAERVVPPQPLHGAHNRTLQVGLDENADSTRSTSDRPHVVFAKRPPSEPIFVVRDEHQRIGEAAGPRQRTVVALAA